MSEVILKPFQIKTVDEIMRRYRDAGIRRLALADEVGLGKTHIMGSVAAQLIKHGGRVYYVAPSLEVADQNGSKLAEDCNAEYIEATRLTMLPIHMASKGKRQLICLSPRTSFDLNTPGDRRERAFLFQIKRRLFAKRRIKDLGFKQRKMSVGSYDFTWMDVFYRPHRDTFLKRRFESEHYSPLEQSFGNWTGWFAEGKKHARKIADALVANDKFVEDFSTKLTALSKSKKRSQRAAFKATASLITLFRYHVALHSMQQTHRPDVVLLDEWHKYQGLIRMDLESPVANGDILAKSLAEWNRVKSRAPKLCLFVSATPFEVSLEAARNDQEQGGINELCKVMDPDGTLSMAISERRKEYQAAWRAYAQALIDGKGSTSEKETCKTAAYSYGVELSNFVVRTERPQHKGGDNTTLGDWAKADIDALIDFKKMAISTESGTDVNSLWASSSHFLLMTDSYDVSEKMGKRHSKEKLKTKCMGDHWKRSCLDDEIRKRWGAEEISLVNVTGKKNRLQRKGPVKSAPILPPLWIAPFAPGRPAPAGKILMFSQYRAVPREVSFFFNDHAKIWKLAHGKTGSPLGAFPPSKIQDAKKTTWRVFYPALWFVEEELAWFQEWLIGELPEAEKQSERSLKWPEILVALDCAYSEYCGETFAKVAERRAGLLKVSMKPWRDVLCGLSLPKVFEALGLSSDILSMPGITLTRALAEVFGLDLIFDPDSQEKILDLARHSTHYFNRPIAYATVKARFKSKKGRKKFEYAREIIDYCHAFEWQTMWKQYGELFLKEGVKPDLKKINSALKAMSEALDSRAVSSGRGWWKKKRSAESDAASLVQPFVETSANDPQSAEEKKAGFASSTSRRRKTFNSPFLPLVLVSTSIGQEGVDFHLYCDTIVHWNPPYSPLALEQREGRVDRYRSFQVRKKEFDVGRLGLLKDEDGLSPDFCVLDRKRNRLNVTDRRVWLLPFSSEYQYWKRCLERLHYFRLFLGSPDPVALERELRDRMAKIKDETRRLEILTKLGEIRVSLVWSGVSDARKAI